MKRFNKQILEAINKGIQLALDDYQNVKQNNFAFNDIVTTNCTIKQKLDLMKEFVDLGLPSGTLWCKHNLGASCIPNDNESWYGDYYAWGETTYIKPNGYNWDTYKFYDGPNLHHKNDTIRDDSIQLIVQKHINKYNVNDGLNDLQLEDDAAYQNMHIHNFKFHIPSIEQANELIKYTKTIYVSDVSENLEYKDAKGYTGSGWFVISKINGNYIFFPRTGLKEGKKPVTDLSTYVWTTQISQSTIESKIKCANTLKFFTEKFNDTNSHCIIYGVWKYKGIPIRPVYNINYN